jgi:hypothetical protein
MIPVFVTSNQQSIGETAIAGTNRIDNNSTPRSFALVLEGLIVALLLGVYIIPNRIDNNSKEFRRSFALVIKGLIVELFLNYKYSLSGDLKSCQALRLILNYKYTLSRDLKSCQALRLT